MDKKKLEKYKKRYFKHSGPPESESYLHDSKFDKEEVTGNMVAETLAHEFPEFVFAFAEENFLRGYQLGLDDATKTVTGNSEEKSAE